MSLLESSRNPSRQTWLGDCSRSVRNRNSTTFSAVCSVGQPLRSAWETWMQGGHLEACSRADLLVDAIADRAPAGDVGGQTALAGDPDRALDRDPAHQPRVSVVPAAAARLPDPSSGWSQWSISHSVAGELHPAVVVDVELQLGRRLVADAHRRRAHVALQVPELLLGQVLAPVDAVHDLQRARLALGGVAEAPLQPIHERAGLLGEPEPEQRVEREGSVAHPRVAVVPVACAAEPLRQAGGGAATIAPVGAYVSSLSVSAERCTISRQRPP